MPQNLERSPEWKNIRENLQFDRNWIGPPELMPRIVRTQSEKDTWYAIAVENEYRMPDKFEASDVVIDIGAHIGSFSWAAHRRGSRHVYSFEIDPWHVEAATVNLGEMLNAQEGALYACAVVRGDEHRAKEYHYDGAWNSFGLLGPTVTALSLDEILTQVVDPVRFLKIDCEGGEYPILYTCTKLDRVEEIAGEYHLVPGTFPELRHLPYDISLDGLRGFLESKGFAVEFRGEEGAHTGNFFAKRNGNAYHTVPKVAAAGSYVMDMFFDSKPAPRSLSQIADELDALAKELRSL